MNLPKSTLFASLVLAQCAAAAPAPGFQIQCFEDPAMLYQYCFAPSKLTANGGVRASPLYAGKGKDVSATALTAVADCRKARVMLKDGKGAVATIQPPLNPQVAKALADDMCAVKKPTIDKALKRP